MKIKPLPVVLAVVLTLAGFLALQAVYKPATSKKNIISPSNTASFNDFDFTEYIQGGLGKKYTIQGKRLGAGNRKFGLFRIAAARITEIKDARVIFYDNNTPVSTIMAKSAVVDLPVGRINSGASSIGRIDFDGDVSIVTADRRTLDCDNLRWNKSNNRVSANGNCVLRGSEEPLRADSIESDIKLRNFVARNDNGNRLKALKRAFI